MLPKHLVLIRHGESERNYAGKKAWQGDLAFFEEIITRPSSTSSLTERGRKQAITTGEWMRRVLGLEFQQWYTSSFVRAKETAGLLDLPGAQWFIENRIRERSSGVLEDMFPQARREYLEQMTSAGHIHDPYNFRPDRGESFADTEDRLRGFLHTLHRSTADAVCVVNHGHCIRIWDAIIHHMTPEDFATIHDDRTEKVHNGSVTHYTRADPVSGEESRYLEWVRTCTPWQDATPSPWRRIARKSYSSEELLAQVRESNERSKAA